MPAPLIGERVFPNVGTEHSSEGVAMPTTVSLRQDTGVRAWVRRHPLTAFLIVGVGLALLVMSVVILAQFGVIPGRSLPGRVGLEMERVAAALSILVLFPAALLITALEAVRLSGSCLLGCCAGASASVWWLFASSPCPRHLLVAVLFGDSAHLPGRAFLLASSWNGGRTFPDQYLGRGDLGGILPDSPGAPTQLLPRGRPDGSCRSPPCMPLQVINGEIASALTWSWPSRSSS